MAAGEWKDAVFFMTEHVRGMTLDEQLAYLAKGCVDVIRLEDLRKKLQRSVENAEPLTVKVCLLYTSPSPRD